MRGVVYNFFNSEIQQTQDAIALRTALLLCKEVTYAGYGKTLFNHFKETDSFTLEMKMHLVADRLNKQGMNETFDPVELYKNYKLINNKKGKNKDEIVWLKHVENRINDLLKTANSEAESQANAGGLYNLRYFTQKEYFHVLSQYEEATEKEDENEKITPLSRMLTLEVSADKNKLIADPMEDPVFFLHPYFVSVDDKTDNNNQSNHTSYNAKYLYRHKLFSLPNILLASVAELESLRNFMQKQGEELTVHIDEWLRRIYAEGKKSELFFLSKVIPACEKLEEDIANQELLKHYDLRGKENTYFELYAGVATLPDIWNYFRAFKAIPDESWNVLMKLKEENKAYNAIFPFFTFEISVRDMDNGIRKAATEVIADDQEIKPIKKNLSFD